MSTKIDRYIARIYFNTFLLVMGCGFILYLLGDMASHLARFTKDAHKSNSSILSIALSYYLVYVPRFYYHLGPVIILMGALFTMVRLQRNHEILALMASGISIQRICLPIFVVSIFLSLSLVGVVEVFLPYWPYKNPPPAFRKNLKANAIRDSNGSIIQALYFEEGSGQIRRNESQSKKGAVPVGIAISQRYANGMLKNHISAKTAIWNQAKGHWLLSDGIKIEYDTDGQIRSDKDGKRMITSFKAHPFYTNIRPLDIAVTSTQEQYLESRIIWEQYQRRGLPHLKVRLHARLAYFFQVFILLLIGIPLLIQRGARGGAHVVLGVIICSIIFTTFVFTTAFFQAMGNEQLLSPMASVWLPYLAFGTVGVEMFSRMST